MGGDAQPPTTRPVKVTWGATTHPGLVRTRNEDAVVARPPIFAVADGMGGHADGNIASELTVRELEVLARQERISRTEVLDAIRRAHAALDPEGERAPGSTVCGLALLNWPSPEPSFVVFNVGDSRCYRMRNGVLVLLTHDHSVVQELLDDGSIRPEDAARHPERHVITRSIGGGGPLDIDWWLTEPEAGDRYLVCSDGLVRELSSEQIAELLATSPSAGDAADALLSAALDGGARDNVSVIVVELRTGPPPADEDPETAVEEDDTEPRSRSVLADTSKAVAQHRAAPADG